MCINNLNRVFNNYLGQCLQLSYLASYTITPKTYLNLQWDKKYFTTNYTIVDLLLKVGISDDGGSINVSTDLPL